ncbi:hypothetical protein [Pseudogracilibacillus sp. SO30301A]|uniref:hypothetical protein n=1 Tax=Pseudogracilibacillus sp. SO30301A TaxID=3098291 RepID=UPI00300E1EA2
MLTDLEIPTIATETSIEEAAGQGENIYRLAKRNDKWAFMFVQYEKQDGKENVGKIFEDEDIACKYYYFFQLE